MGMGIWRLVLLSRDIESQTLSCLGFGALVFCFLFWNWSPKRDMSDSTSERTLFWGDGIAIIGI